VLSWQKNPGGKRYSTTSGGIFVEIVRQNTAAGAARWRAVAGRDYPKRIIISTDYLADAKQAVEAFLAAR
jgi:hypothetical protein